jgi:hypothetical protein
MKPVSFWYDEGYDEAEKRRGNSLVRKLEIKGIPGPFNPGREGSE